MVLIIIIMAPVVHFHTIILSHMTTTPDVVSLVHPHHQLELLQVWTLPPMPPGQDHCLLALAGMPF